MKKLCDILEETGARHVTPAPKVEATDVITPEHLYHHFDVDGDGIVTVEDYASTILWHELHPGKMEWIMGNMDGVHLEHATSDDSECAVSLHEDFDREVDLEKLDEAHTKSTMLPPTMIIMNRVAIRQYPNGQRVALYYAKSINKYLTVPYNDIGIADLSKE